MPKKRNIFLFLLYLVIGAYLILNSLNLFSFPDALVTIEKWIFFVGGVLVIVGGINHLRVRLKKNKGDKESS